MIRSEITLSKLHSNKDHKSNLCNIQSSDLYFAINLQAYQFVGHLVINFVAAIFAALVFDFPFRNLKRIAQGKPLDAPY